MSDIISDTFDLYFTTEELAKLYRCAKSTIRKRAREGKFKGIKIGKRWLFKKELYY